MRKVTRLVIQSFLDGRPRRVGNTHTDGHSLFLHGNCIAWKAPHALWISHCGWKTRTTQERLNGLPGVSISQRDFTWYLNGEEWSDGKPREIGTEWARPFPGQLAFRGSK
jgi:hypothetical protein